MSNERIAALVSVVALVGVIFAAGQRMGAQTAELAETRAKVNELSAKVDALGADLNGSRLEVLRLVTEHISGGGR